MAKYTITATLVYKYDVEAETYGEAILKGSDFDNIDQYDWVLDIENVHAVLADETEEN